MAFTNLYSNKYQNALDASAFVIDDATNKTLFGVTIDNEANTLPTFVKIYFGTISPTVGTTQPDQIIRVEASKKQDFSFHGGTVGIEGVPSGASNNIYVVALTTGGTAGVTAPANAVSGEFFTS